MNVSLQTSTSQDFESEIREIAHPSTSEVDQMIELVRNVCFNDRASFRVLLNSGSNNLHEFMLQITKGPSGCKQSDMPSSRETVQQVETHLITEIARRYLSPTQKTVEVGAGKLDQDNRSYLMQRVPTKLAESIEPTEVNRFLTDQNRRNLKHLDSLNLETFYSLNSVDSVIGSAFLDVLSQVDLTATMKQIHSILKDAGLLIHVSSLDPFRDVFISFYNNENTVCFPWMDDDFLKDCKSFLKKISCYL